MKIKDNLPKHNDAQINKIIENFEGLRPVYKEVKKQIVNDFKDSLDLKGGGRDLLNFSPIITSRVKSEASLRTKLEGGMGWYRSKYQNYTNVTDLIGIRIIVNSPSSVKKVERWFEDKFKDVIDTPNSGDKRQLLEPTNFGYKSTHYIIRLKDTLELLGVDKELIDQVPPMARGEVQIRTTLEHAWAEAAHELDYKDLLETSDDIKRTFAQLASQLEVGDILLDSLETKVEEHRGKVSDLIEAKNYTELKDMRLDPYTLDAYIELSDILKDLYLGLDSSIKEPVDEHFWNRKVEILKEFVDIFKMFNIKTLDELDQFIKKFKNNIVNYTNEKHKDNMITIYQVLWSIYDILTGVREKEESSYSKAYNEIFPHLIEEHIALIRKHSQN